jgi:hypothetical protein
MTLLPPGRDPDPSLASALERLHAELVAATASGRAVFLFSAPGSGGAALARRFVDEARRANPRLEIATGDAADPAVAAWRQIARRMTRTRRAGVALRHTLADWASILPLIGPVISAAISTIDELRSGPRRTTVQAGTDSAVADVRMLLAHGARSHRLIVLENLESADAAELAGAFSLIQKLARTRILLVVTAATDAFHPAPRVLDLLREAERIGVGHRIELHATAPLDGRLSDLAPDHADVIRCAVRFGAPFTARDVAGALGRAEAAVEADLSQLARRKLITLRETVERDGDLVDVYEPVPGGLPDGALAVKPQNPASS